MQIPIAKPYFGKEEEEAVARVLESGWVVQGRRVKEFEEMMCEFTEAKFAKASTSCTTSLHLALLALGIGREDEVLVPSFTFIASANAVEYTGARPVFVDIDLSTFNISPKKVEEYLEQAKKRRTRVAAIIPVHLFGLTADMDPIMELAREHNLSVVEDAACALGSLYNSRHAGTFGDAGCFSFHPRKSITTGEGGMLITNNAEIDARVQSLRDHGAAISDLQRHEKGDSFLPDYDILGYNYRMTDIQAAVGVEQMKKLPWMLKSRIEIAEKYNEALKHMEWLQLPLAPKGYKHAYQSYVLLLRDPNLSKPSPHSLEKLHDIRNTIMTKLNEKGIANRQGTSAVHRLNYYRRKYGLEDDDCPLSLQADYLTITLPLYPQMTEEEQGYVIDNLLKIVKSELG